jgi:hypothetical protein
MTKGIYLWFSVIPLICNGILLNSNLLFVYIAFVWTQKFKVFMFFILLVLTVARGRIIAWKKRLTAA